ncbi:hypothetical protein SAMN05428975_0901 [Mucilaginibacter sp. OK268]|uniref:hypothetical protein n=1 Tax=Mucilaginibacter sp. OK268 TaxID=1881048 RepID=UPI000884AF49|nr:hypothetical protein [Mucilaginibacter sp. OK268]SDP26014.1 hypothetical protein SAMN05428975_0901 [Mucilaginibacter sp. OK268]
MKRALICFTLISIALLSCKKSSHTQTDAPTGKLYPVTFKVSNFTQQNTPIPQDNKTKVNAVVPPAQANIIRLIYRVYDSNNTLKRTIITKKSGPNFGTISDSLATGNYTAVIVGLTDTIQYSNDATTFFYIPLNLYSGFLPEEFKETFYKKTSFTVGNQPLQQSVTIDRLNAELQVVVKDAIPAGVTLISVNVYNTETHYSFFDDASSDTLKTDGTLNYRYTDTSVPLAAVGTTNFAATPVTDLLNTHAGVRVTISAYRNDGKPGTYKTIYNVTIQRNTRTLLTGNLFSNSTGNQSFNVTYNSIYNPDINKGF